MQQNNAFNTFDCVLFILECCNHEESVFLFVPSVCFPSCSIVMIAGKEENIAEPKERRNSILDQYRGY